MGREERERREGGKRGTKTKKNEGGAENRKTGRQERKRQKLGGAKKEIEEGKSQKKKRGKQARTKKGATRASARSYRCTHTSEESEVDHVLRRCKMPFSLKRLSP